MNKKKVLVLLATFNGQKFLEKQLESILSQKEVDIEILISDDFSTDNSLNIINKVIQKKNISVLNNLNKFRSAGHNFFNLIENSNTNGFDYVAFSDQDDFWFDDKIITAIDIIEKHSVDALSSDVIAYWPIDGKKRLIKKSFPQKKFDYWFEGPGPGCSQVLKVSVFNFFRKFVISNKKLLKSITSHDWLIYTFLRYNNFKWIISNEPKMLYNQHGNNDQGANYGLKAKINRLKKIDQGWYKNEIRNIYKIITNKNFDDFVKSNKLILKPFDLRRKKIDSIFIWFLIFFRSL